MATIEYAELARKLWPFLSGYVGQYSGGNSVLTAAASSSPTSGSAPDYASFLTLGTDATLTAERVLTAGAGLTGTDAGAGSTYTLAVGAGTGITVNADDVAVNQSYGFTWTGTHTFNPSGGSVILSNSKAISTSSFSSGFAGSGLRLDQGVSYASQTTLEVDNVIVRGLMRVYELVINKIRVSRGSLIVSPGGGKVASVSGSGPYTLTFDDDHGILTNDLLRAQKFTGSGTYTSLLTVTGVPTSTTATVTVSSGSAPLAGYEYAVVGNTGTSTRQGGLFLTADDSGAPFMDIYDGVAAHSDFNTYAKTKARLGKLTGITDSFFGTLTGYGLYTSRAYLNGAYINGSLVVGPGVGFSTTAALYCAFDAAPGTIVPNLNGHLGQAATVAGSPAAGGGAFGGNTGSVTITGTNRISYVATNNYSKTAGSMSVWVYVTDKTVTRTIMAGSASGDLAVFATSTNISVSRKDTETVANLAVTWSNNTWQHVCVTWSNRVVKAYVDGVYAGTGTASADFATMTTLLVGNYYSDGSLYPFNNTIDDFAIIPRVLTDDEVNAIYKSRVPLNITRSNFELTLADSSSAAKVVANSYGIFGTDASAKPTFSLINAASTVNGESLTAGDTMLGDNSSGKGNILFDQNPSGVLKIRAGTTDILSFGSNGSIEGIMSLGTSGEIRQGSGTVGSNFTGLRIRRSGSDGWIEVFDTDAYTLSLTPSNALTVVGGTGYDGKRAVNFVDSAGTRLGELFSYSDSSTYNAIRVNAYSSSSTRPPFAYLMSSLENTSGTATTQLIATKFTSPSTLDRPTATVSNFINAATPLASITLEVKSKTGSIASLTLQDSNGTLTWAASGVSKSWRIDHPLKPTTHWLDHATVEGPENYTFYRGNVTLDSAGHATVQMPDWFDALNDDLVITYGDWGEATRARTSHRIANGWVIVGQPRQRVSWMASGLRADAWAKAHPFKVETEKDEANYGKVFAWQEHGYDESYAPPSVADLQQSA